MNVSNSFASDLKHDPYGGVVIVLLALALVGAVAAVAAGVCLANPVLLDTAVALGISAGVLSGVALTQIARVTSTVRPHANSVAVLTEAVEIPADVLPAQDASSLKPKVPSLPVEIWLWFRNFK